MSGIIPSVKHIRGTGTPRIVIVYTTPQFINTAGSATFDATHAYAAGESFTGVKVNQRVMSYALRGTVQIPTFGKVTGIATGVLTVDAWTNGTPTNAQFFVVDGFVCDLPRTQEDGMSETFDPEVFIQFLWNGDNGSRAETEMRGWKYDCVLDYSKYISPDTLLDLDKVLAQGANDNLILIPRRDAPQFQYNVYYSGAITLKKYGRAPGYKGTVFAFKSKTNLPGWGMIDGHGTNYGNDYGHTGW
jgi:hypothetical protein